MDNNKQTEGKKSEWSEREIGALWRVDGEKQSFYSGEIKIAGKPVKIVCFTNKYKEAESNQPDLRIYQSKEVNQ